MMSDIQSGVVHLQGAEGQAAVNQSDNQVTLPPTTTTKKEVYLQEDSLFIQ